MSIRARKVLNIETAPPSFNLSKNYDWLAPYAERETEDFMTFDRDNIIEEIKHRLPLPKQLKVLDIILNDIGTDDAVDYYLY